MILTQLHPSFKIKKKIMKYLQDNNIANRGQFDGDKDKQFVGLLGEHLIYQYFFGEEKEFSQGFDGGYDFEWRGYKVDVKTMQRNVSVKDFYVNNFCGLQKDLKCEILIFTSYWKPSNVFEICGWIGKNIFLDKAIHEPPGTKQYRSDNTSFTLQVDNYKIENKQLNPIQTLWQLGQAFELDKK